MRPGGRSSGCRTCRMRHVKCDEAKPACARCTKAKIECRGYDAVEVFVDERDKTIQRSGSKAKAKEKASSLPPEISKEITAPTLPEGRAASSLSSSVTQQQIPLCSISKPLVASFEEVYIIFLVDNLTGSGLGRHVHAAIVETAWLSAVLDKERPSTALDFAASALAAAFFGKLQYQPHVTELAMSRYGTALSKLQDDIAGPNWSNKDTLAAAMCLIMLESVMFTNPLAWKGHASGIERLIEARGPATFKDRQSLQLLRSNRMPIIMACMIDRKPCFLEREEWKRIPWEDEPGGKHCGDFLFDVLANFPRILAEAEALETRADSAPNPRAFYLKVLGYLQELYLWRWRWERVNPQSVETVASTAEPQSLFATSLQFSNISSAHVISMYNSILILFVQLLKRLSGPGFDVKSTLPGVSELPQKTNPLILPGMDAIDLRAVAQEVCKCIKFRIERVNTGAVVFGLFIPMRMAWSVLQNVPGENEWLRRMAYVLEQRSGIELTKLVLAGPANPNAHPGLREALLGRGIDDPAYSLEVSGRLRGGSAH